MKGGDYDWLASIIIFGSVAFIALLALLFMIFGFIETTTIIERG